MSTRQDANTVLGTPYYISPEMCEGKTYNEKSDMWALGCILYEMANLQKTFEGTNLPALVNKIMKGSFAPVKEIFSVEFRVLVRDLLSREPSLRPSAQELLIYRLPELLEKFDTHTGRDDLDIAGSGTRRSLLYYADVSTGMLYQVHGLPSKMHITEVSVGLSHVVVVSMERGIFCWGDNTYGQLGVDDQIERESPTEVVGLRGKSILRASCGDDFTAFLSDNGLLLTCGRGDYGCLGHGNWTTLLKPKLNDELLTRDVISLSCGRHHVAVASADGAAFTWGLGDDGRLGLGADESRRCTPCEVDFSETVAVREVRCSADGTVFIMDTGVIFACGKNNCNKLRLNPRQGFLQQIKLSRANKSIESVKTATLVKDLCRYQIADICFGSNHSAILTEAGLVATMGSNTEGQLGYGHTKSRDMLTNVKGLEEEQIYTIACGVTFTLAGTRNNAVFFWGSKRSTRTQSHSESSPSPSQSMNSASASKSLRSRKSSLGSFEEPAPAVDKSGSFGTEMDMTDWRSDSEGRGMKRQDSSGPKKSRADSAKSLPDKTSIQGSISDSVFDCEADKVDQRRQNFLRNIARKKHGEISTGLLKMADKESQAVVLPAKIFEFTGLSGIEGYDESDEYPVYLQDIKCSFDHVFLQLDTIAPSPKRRKRLSRKESKQKFGSKLDESSSSVASHGQDELNSSEASGMDLTGNVPSWIKDELKGGIPVDASAEASNEDSSDTDQSEAVNTTNHNSTPSNAPKATVIRKPSSSSAATSQQAPERFVFRRTSNHSITRHRELRNKIISSSNSSQATLNEAPATAGALNEAPKTETTIVDGVAITTTTSLTTPTQLISSPTPTHGNSSRSSSVTEIEMSPTPRSTSKVGASYGENTDQGITVGQRPKMAKQACAVVNSEQSMNLSQVFPRPASTPSKRNSEQIRDIGGVAAGPVKNMFADSGVEFTPVESFTSETELSSSKKSSEDRMNNRKSASSSGERPRNGKPRKPQPHNQTRERANEIRSRGVARGRLGPSKGKGTYNIERNAMREDEAAKLCEQLRAMRDLHEKQEKHLESVKREAMESELRLKHQIEKLRLEKSEAAQDLHRSQEEHLRLAEAKMVVQREESARREAHLQSEVTMLKDELRSQSEKLQESFNMLITVQEQMLKMQQEQFKIQQQNQMTDSGSISQMSSKDVQSPGMLSPRESNQRSKTPTSISSNQSKSAVCSVIDSWLEDTLSFVQSNKLDVILVMFIHKEAELTRREILVFATDLQLKESICARLLRMSEYLDLSDFEVDFETQSKLRDLHVGFDATDPMKSGVGGSEKSLLKEGDCESTNKKSESVDNHRPKYENCRGVENSEDFNHKDTELLFHGSTTKEHEFVHCTNEAGVLQTSFSDGSKESSSPVSFKDFENDDADNSFRQFEITEKQTFSCVIDESARNCSELRENAVLSKHDVASEGSCEKSFDEMDKSLEQPTLEFEYDWTSELYDMSSANKNNSSQPEKKHKIMIRDLSFDESNTLPALLGMDLLCPVFLAVTEDDQDDDVVLKDIRRKSKSIENICAVLSSDEEEFPLRRTKSELPMQRRKRVLHKLHGDARKRLNSISRHDSISEEAAFEENPFSCDRQFSVDEIDTIKNSAECKRSISRESSDVISDKRSTRSYSDPLGCHENGGGKPIERFSFSDESFEMYETHEEDCDCSQCRKASFIDEDGYCSSPQHVPGLWERFITVNVGNSLRVVDLQLIEPYVKVMSHGGFYEVDGERRVIMVFTAAFLPKKFIPKYKIIMEQLFYYVVHTLDLSVSDKYDIVYFNNSGPNMPGRNWLKGCYHMIARRLKKNLQSLYLVHPDFWLKAMVRFYRPFAKVASSTLEKMESIVKNLEKKISNSKHAIGMMSDVVQPDKKIGASHVKDRIYHKEKGIVPKIKSKPDESICKFSDSPSGHTADIRMMDVFDQIPFDNPDGGVWKQGWDVQYNRDAFDKDELLVFVVPHSHNDPGWIKTVDQYYEDQTRHILDNVVDALSENRRRKFIWAEISYFSMWWEQTDEKRKSLAKDQIENGQLEIVTGGWVMNDEANPHYYAIIDHLIEGHQWLERNIGVKPKTGWAIDPFGHSPTMAYVLKRAGFDAMLIQRTHYSVKKYLAQSKNLEFMWRQNWDHSSSTDMLCHMMPFYSYDIPHTCGPDPKVCCQFDFRRLPGGGMFCPWMVPPVEIDTSNVAERALMLLDQYRKKAQLYKNNIVLAPLGDDFRYEQTFETKAQYENYQLIIDYINSHPDLKAKVQFGTLSDYFDAVWKRTGSQPGSQPSGHSVLSGDFFTYADRDDHYWSGYYTSRSFYKHMDRVLEANHRAAEIIFSLMLSNARGTKYADDLITNDMFRKLTGARKDLGLFQHHDGVTGTAKDHVVIDYGERMLRSINNCQYVMEKSAEFLLSKDNTITNQQVIQSIDSRAAHDSLVSKKVIIISSQPQTIVIYNSLAQERKQVVTVHVSEALVEVENSDGDAVESQTSLIFNREQKPNAQKFKLSFLATIPPLGISVFKLRRNLKGNPAKIEFLNGDPPSFSNQAFQMKRGVSEDVIVHNDYMQAVFDPALGLVRSNSPFCTVGFSACLPVLNF
eukprot:gene19542-21474_t